MKNKIELNEEVICKEYLETQIGVENMALKYHVGKKRIKDILEKHNICIKKRGGQNLKVNNIVSDWRICKFKKVDGKHYIAVDKRNGFTTKDYENKDFWTNHQIVSFDTLKEHRQYQIFAAFNTEIPSAGQEGFRYYDLVGELSQEQYKELLDGIKNKQFYETGLSPSEGQQILILSTCSYHAKNGRCVLAAYRIR